MTGLPVEAVSGHQVTMWATHPGHAGYTERSGEGMDFGSMVMESLQEVSNLETDHAGLATQAILNPESVDAHDVTIAAAKASLAINITKNVVDAVIQAYQNITNLR
jgi:flagellar hook-basal body complex protein FliE